MNIVKGNNNIEIFMKRRTCLDKMINYCKLTSTSCSGNVSLKQNSKHFCITLTCNITTLKTVGGCGIISDCCCFLQIPFIFIWYFRTISSELVISDKTHMLCNFFICQITINYLHKQKNMSTKFTSMREHIYLS